VLVVQVLDSVVQEIVLVVLESAPVDQGTVLERAGAGWLQGKTGTVLGTDRRRIRAEIP